MTHPATGEPPDELVLARRGRRQASTALMVATAMQAFDATIVNVALPRLEASFGGNMALGTWVVTSYLCAAAVTAPLTGWLRRRYGARQSIMGAVSFFVLASLVCSLAPSPMIIILFRVVQGAAAGVIQPLAQATLLDISPKREHGRMLALWGATIMTGPVIGPALGGALTDLASWRWIFAINLPLGLIAAAGLRRLPASVEGRQEAGFDLSGIILLGIGVGALQLALERGIGRTPFTSPETAVEAVAALFALSVVGFQSRRERFSLFNFRVFKDINYSAAVFYTFMIGALLFSTIVLVPAFSEGPFGYSAMTAGLILFPRGAMTLALMLILARLIGRIDHRIFLFVGLVTMAAALALIAAAPQHGGALWLGAASALLGVGVGLLFTPLSTLAFSTIPEELRTDGAGLYSLLRQLGSATGVTTLVTLLQARINVHLVTLGAVNNVHPQASAAHIVRAAEFAAYGDGFRIMAIVTLAILPGIFVFRAPSGEGEKPSAL